MSRSAIFSIEWGPSIRCGASAARGWLGSASPPPVHRFWGRTEDGSTPATGPFPWLPGSPRRKFSRLFTRPWKPGLRALCNRRYDGVGVVLRQEIGGPRRRIGALPNAVTFLRGDPKTGQSLSGGETIPGGDKSFVPGGVGIFFSIEGKDPRRDGTPSNADGTTSPTRTCPNLTPFAETTWEGWSVGRDTFAE